MAETCVQGRGVLIDLLPEFGRARTLVTYADIARIMERDGVVVEAGDMLCFHTGYGQALIDMGGKPDPEVLHNASPCSTAATSGCSPLSRRAGSLS